MLLVVLTLVIDVGVVVVLMVVVLVAFLFLLHIVVEVFMVEVDAVIAESSGCNSGKYGGALVHLVAFITHTHTQGEGGPPSPHHITHTPREREAHVI